MDRFLLQAVAAEIAGRVVEQEIQRVACLDRDRILVRFASPARENLIVSIRPESPRLHLLRPGVRRLEAPPDRFAALLDREIGGAVLTACATPTWDRVVRLDFRLPRRDDAATGRALVVELTGRTSNAALLDERGVVIAPWRASADTRLSPGTAYAPPRGREAYEALAPDPRIWPEIQGRLESPAAFLRPMSPILARDLEGHPDPAGRLREILAAAGAGAWRPAVYSTRPLEAWREGDLPGRDDLFAVALALAYPPEGTSPTFFDSPSAAAEAAWELADHLRDFHARRSRHQAIARKEVTRLAALEAKLVGGLEAAAGGERHRRLGEALLAGLACATVTGSRAIVPDPWSAEGATLEVPIDPDRPLADNARLLFERARKARRAVEMIGRRLAAVRARLVDWRAVEDRARTVSDASGLEEVKAAMGRLGIVHAPAAAATPAASRRAETPARVRRFVSREGFTILVGKDADENETLTFRVASPWDFWMHAAGHPGAHVVVRNPSRLRALPEAALRVAAEAAAYFSGGRGEGRVEVHYTQRKHVHKRKGGPRGQVLVRRFRSIQVAPRPPASTIDEA